MANLQRIQFYENKVRFMFPEKHQDLVKRISSVLLYYSYGTSTYKYNTLKILDLTIDHDKKIYVCGACNNNDGDEYLEVNSELLREVDCVHTVVGCLMSSMYGNYVDDYGEMLTVRDYYTKSPCIEVSGNTAYLYSSDNTEKYQKLVAMPDEAKEFALELPKGDLNCKMSALVEKHDACGVVLQDCGRISYFMVEDSEGNWWYNSKLNKDLDYLRRCGASLANHHVDLCKRLEDLGMCVTYWIWFSGEHQLPMKFVAKKRQ